MSQRPDTSWWARAAAPSLCLAQAQAMCTAMAQAWAMLVGQAVAQVVPCAVARAAATPTKMVGAMALPFAWAVDPETPSTTARVWATLGARAVGLETTFDQGWGRGTLTGSTMAQVRRCVMGKVMETL